jgi:hypothetical protein
MPPRPSRRLTAIVVGATTVGGTSMSPAGADEAEGSVRSSAIVRGALQKDERQCTLYTAFSDDRRETPQVSWSENPGAKT